MDLLSEVVTKEAIIFFELLDMRSSLRLKSNDPSTNFRIKRIAWAFLLPVGGGDSKDDPEHCNVGLLPDWTRSTSSQSSSIRRRKTEENSELDDPSTNEARDPHGNFDARVALQLHAFTPDGVVESMQRKSLGWPEFAKNLFTKDDPAFPYSVPEVYMQWRRRQLVELPTALKVSLGPAPLAVELDNVPSLSLKEPASEDKAQVGGAPPSSAARKKHQYVRHLTQEMRQEISRRSRTDAEPCRIPDTLLHKLDVGPFGAMSIAFSHCGIFLAVSGESAISYEERSSSSDKRSSKGKGLLSACKYCLIISLVDDKIYSLQIFDSDTGEKVWADTRAHYGIVYQIRWSLNDYYLITSSADGSVILWDMAGIVNAVLYASQRPNFYMVLKCYAFATELMNLLAF